MRPYRRRERLYLMIYRPVCNAPCSWYYILVRGLSKVAVKVQSYSVVFLDHLMRASKSMISSVNYVIIPAST